MPREQVKDAKYFRSTWLSSSLRALRERALIDRYFTLLPTEHHQAIRETVAGIWLPVDVALAHYTACNELGLSRADSTEIGLEVTRHVHGPTLSLPVRLARQAGVTPWWIFGQLQRLWDRVWRGGAIAVYRHGPKDAKCSSRPSAGPARESRTCEGRCGRSRSDWSRCSAPKRSCTTCPRSRRRRRWRCACSGMTA